MSAKQSGRARRVGEALRATAGAAATVGLRLPQAVAISIPAMGAFLRSSGKLGTGTFAGATEPVPSFHGYLRPSFTGRLEQLRYVAFAKPVYRSKQQCSLFIVCHHSVGAFRVFPRW